ncbi:hypothetical protein [Variovorax sp. J31P207]|uniref:hypothetical protein n=1 Tax=Variovorax sp. J31P207 TaxID=3053510 RepID=UPI002576ACA2|nr:hypothetical protein [Variovorax sp. J31P207]
MANQPWKLCVAIAVIAGASIAHAEDLAVTADEFQASVVNKTMRVKSTSGKVYEMQLRDGGKAIVAVDYNDVGRWRPAEPNGFCLSWNKQAPTENCYTMVRRDGALAILSANGTLGSWVESVR